MPIVGYMKTSDLGRISSITNLDGDKERRKKIKEISWAGKEPLKSLYVLDCLSHEPGGAVVPVVLKRYVPGLGWEDLGVAQCCPLCWRILRRPVGADLPEAIDQPAIGDIIKNTVVPDRTNKRTPAVKRTLLSGFEIQQKVVSFLEPIAYADIYEIMALLGCSRQTALKHLDRLIRVKKVIKIVEGGGMGHKSLYQKAP